MKTSKRRHRNKHNNQTNWPGPEEVANYLHNMHYNSQLSVRGVFPKSSTIAKSEKRNQEVDVENYSTVHRVLLTIKVLSFIVLTLTFLL